MDWSHETILMFLDYYQKEEMIWNASHGKHNNRKKVSNAWKRIQSQMGPEYTVEELKRKKDSLMASFRTNHNKVKASINSGASNDNVYKPSWFAYEQMAKFLRDKDETRETIKAEVNQSQSLEKHSSEQFILDSSEDEDSVEMPSTSNSSFKTTVGKRKRVTVEEHNIKTKMDNASSETGSILQATPQKQGRERDMCDIYGELVAAKLRRLDEHTRQICMHKVDTVMFEMFETMMNVK